MTTENESGAPQVPELSRGHQILNRWLRDLHKRPEVYWHYDRLCRQLLDRGIEHYGSKGVYETMRYHTVIETKDETGVKVSNDYTAWYARFWTLMNPGHEGFFRFRPLKSFQKPPTKKKWHVDGVLEWTDPKIDVTAPTADESILEALRELARHLVANKPGAPRR